jgi:hypothetical protein
MRRLLLLLLLLPLPLVCQVKILMPVVVKDTQGRPVTDLKLSDFQVTGPKNVSIDRMWLVPPQTVSERDTRTPVLVLYDAASAEVSDPAQRTKWLRWFLGMVAQHRLPVTFYINEADGLHLIYDPTTPPEVLSAALALRKKPKATTTDPKVEEEAETLSLLSTCSPVRNFPYPFYSAANQMHSLIAVAHLLQQSDTRKAVIWLADPIRVPEELTGDNSRSLYEAGIEELNAAHVSVYPDVFSHTFGSYPQLPLAKDTGGLSFNGLSNPLPATLSDFGSYYMLAVAVPTPRDLRWIPIKIKVNRHGLKVRAAPGFYGLKPLKTPKSQATQP